MTNKEKIEEIVYGIGSPYGEGAEYNGKRVSRDRHECHLDDEGIERMMKDIETLIQERERKAVRGFVEYMKSNILYSDYPKDYFLGRKTEDVVNELQKKWANIYVANEDLAEAYLKQKEETK